MHRSYHLRIFALALVSFASFPVLFGQKLSLGFSAGPSKTEIKVEGSTFEDYSPRFGFTAKSMITWNLSKHFGIGSGLEFEQKGTKWNVVFTDENGELLEGSDPAFVLSYLTVPLWIEGRLGGGKTQGILQLGQSFSYLVGYKTRFPTPNTLPVFAVEDFERFDYSLLAGLGLERKLNESVSFQFLVRYAHGLTNIGKSHSNFLEEVSPNNTAYSATVGLRFALGTKEP